MDKLDWNELYPDGFMFSLTDKDRRYLALDPIAPDLQSLTFTRKEDTLHTRVTVFFRGDTIVKVISETLAGKGGAFWLRQYEEYDTHLLTESRQTLLPLTSRGKPKKLTASNINAVTPFGCTFYIQIRSNTLFSDTEMCLANRRSCKRFPLDPRDAIRAIRSEEDFRKFLDHYIATCREDYFDKLQAFKASQKATVKFKPGDIFRMDYDRTQYCYGIITGELKTLKSMAQLPREHSFLHLMTVPIMVRLYKIVTENPNLTPADLSAVPLGPVIICSDNDILWGTHPIIGHRILTPEDLYFKLNCTLQTHYTGRFTREGSSMTIEWGFASVKLTNDQLSDVLKGQLDRFALQTGGVSTGIGPDFAPVDGSPNWADDRYDLLDPRNSDLRSEVFACLGLDADTTFDQFAEKFGGLTRSQIISRMT